VKKIRQNTTVLTIEMYSLDFTVMQLS